MPNSLYFLFYRAKSRSLKIQKHVKHNHFNHCLANKIGNNCQKAISKLEVP